MTQYSEDVFYAIQDFAGDGKAIMRMRFFGILAERSGERLAEFIMIVHPKDDTLIVPVMTVYACIGEKQVMSWELELSSDFVREHLKNVGLDESLEAKDFAMMYIHALKDSLNPVTKYPSHIPSSCVWKCTLSEDGWLTFPLTYKVRFQHPIGQIEKRVELPLKLETPKLSKEMFHSIRELSFREPGRPKVVQGMAAAKPSSSASDASPRELAPFSEVEQGTEVTTTKSDDGEGVGHKRPSSTYEDATYSRYTSKPAKRGGGTNFSRRNNR